MDSFQMIDGLSNDQRSIHKKKHKVYEKHTI
jgi:hypothetical protein